MKTANLIAMMLCLLFTTMDANAALKIYYEGCDEFRAVNTDADCLNCYEDSPAWIGNKMDYKWRLQKKNSSGNWVNEGFWQKGTDTKVYSNLAPGTYRVRGFHSVVDGASCTPAYSFSGQQIGCIGAWDNDGSSASIEIGQPIVDATLDANVFCPGDPVFIDGSDSFGEKAYYISISQLDSNGNSVNWEHSEWINERMGVVNLRDVWARVHTSWDFWPGYTYEVTVALSQTPCTGWVAQTYDFDVVICKTGLSLETPLSIYPNPASNYVNIKGYDDLTGNVNAVVFDLQGKTVKSETLYSNTLDVSSLNDGMYLVQITNEEGVIHSDKLMVRGNSK